MWLKDNKNMRWNVQKSKISVNTFYTISCCVSASKNTLYRMEWASVQHTVHLCEHYLKMYMYRYVFVRKKKDGSLREFVEYNLQMNVILGMSQHDWFKFFYCFFKSNLHPYLLKKVVNISKAFKVVTLYNDKPYQITNWLLCYRLPTTKKGKIINQRPTR